MGRHDRDLVAELSQLGLFAGCRPRTLRRIADLAQITRLRAGEVVMLERFHGEQFHVILGGTVRVSHGEHTVAELGPGDLLGEMALLNRGDRTATVVATAPLRMLTFDANGFAELLRIDPRVGDRIRAEAASRAPSAPTTATP